MAATTVLIAEDVPVDAIVIRNILEHAGYRALVARSGEEALEALDAHPEISLLVADVGMPGMSGVELLRAIRDRADVGGLPAVFVSGSADSGTVRAAVSLGPAGYILKPVNEPSRVLERVSQALEGAPAVLEEGDAVRSRTGMSSQEYRAACRTLAGLLRRELGRETDGVPESEEPGDEADLARLARKLGARRLVRVLEEGAPPPVRARELAAALNLLELEGA